MKLSHSYSSIKMFENCALRYYYQRISKEVVDKGGPASVYGERIHKQLEERLRDGTPLPEESAQYERIAATLEHKAAGKTLLVEQEYTLNKDLKPTGWWDADAWMRSKLDVLIISADGKQAFVCDYKTGKRRPDFSQLELFALQVFAHHPEVEKVTSTFIWLKDVAMDSETYTKDNEPVMWRKMLAKVRRITDAAENDKWPARPSGLCPWCPAQHLCKFK